MNVSQGEVTSAAFERVELSDTVRKIFDDIFDGPMDKFKKPLTVIRENEFGLVWRQPNERDEKVRSVAKDFLHDITINLGSKHADVAEHIEGSTCDLFLQYAHKKLDESLLGEHPFENSCKEIKQLIKKKTSQIKATLEIKHDDQPVQKSNLEVMISKTDLLDPIHMRHSLLCCKAANEYKDSESWKNSLSDLEKNGETHLLSDLCVSYENEHVPKYVMARCGDVLYVSFKGMQTHNFGTTEKSYRGEICAGVSETAQKIPLKYFAQEVIQKKRIIFSGHSSGGAVAALVLVFLLERFKNQSEEFFKSHFKCITFGLMPLGDTTFKQYVQAIPGVRECFCHIVGENDIVPKLFGSFNMSKMQNKLWETVEMVLRPTFQFNSNLGHSVSQMLKFILDQCEEHTGLMRQVVGFDHLDIFGTYYILHTSTPEQKYSVQTPEQAAEHMRIKDFENLRKIGCQLLINHKLERYAHHVQFAFPQDLPDLKKLENGPKMTIMDDISPKITGVRFENIGEEVIAKIYGTGMWFVYDVSIEGVNCDGDNLPIDVTKSSDCEIQTKMRETHLHFKGELRTRVKTHFHNSKYLPQNKVPADTTTYRVTRRQQQLAKHSPRGVMELAYLSALLEHCQEGPKSNRFTAIKEFFENAVLVVPLDSLFHAIASADLYVMLQCCELFSCEETLATLTLSSEFVLPSLERALLRIEQLLESGGFTSSDFPKNHEIFNSVGNIDDDDHISYLLDMPDDPNYRKMLLERLYNAYDQIFQLREKCRSLTGSAYNIDLKVLYPSDDINDTRESNCKAPMTLLNEGRKELNRLSEKLIAEHSQFAEESTSSNTNVIMLQVLTNFRIKFETCSTLLGAFMESQVQIPLEKAVGDGYVNKVAEHAKSFGLSVWGLLILPFKVLDQLVSSDVSEDFRQLVIEFSHKIHGIYNYMFPGSANHFPDYEERLKFLVGSMKQGWTCNQNYVSYSLERQLEDHCKKRNIYHNTPVDEILNQWNNNFENETLTLIPNEYRRLLARWIRWSLMINNLRESLANQTAVGVIGLINSGKSKFVRSLFGKETIAGTTDQKRTTVPLIYNVGQNIEGMDVIDFPGVDDRDESISDLAELLLSLTRIIIFVVDYRRAHSESTQEWLSILAEENVPVLICLTFADKLFAELMGENGDCDIEKIKLGVGRQLDTIKEQIGQPASGHQRHFMLTVFSFDNDSNLNTDEGKKKLREAGLKDEVDVGRWIADKLQDDDQNDVFQNVIKFIEGKKESTLNSNCELIGQPPLAKRKRLDGEKRLGKASSSRGEQPTCSKNCNPL